MICIICNKEFTPKNSLHKYCSDKCKKKSNNKNVITKRSNKRLKIWESLEHKKICLVCGDNFEMHTQHRTQKYCSDKCRRKAERLFGKKAEKDMEYRNKENFGGNMFISLERDLYTCQICNNKNSLVVHHKDLSGSAHNPNNNIDNLVTLCRKCHAALHAMYSKPSNYKDISKDQIIKAIERTKTIQDAADELGVTRKTLLHKRKQYGLL